MTDIVRHVSSSAAVSPAEQGVVVAPTTNTDWPAILAGAAIASAISVVLAAFGSAIGLSLASPYGGVSPATHYVALTLWVLWVTIVSFAAGGYVCGRLRHRSDDVTTEEVDMRDGAHGLVVWAISTLLFAGFAGSSLYQVARTGAEAGANVLTQSIMAGSQNAGAQAAGVSNIVGTPVDRRVDELLRGSGSVRPGGGAPAMIDEGSRQIVRRILAGGMMTGDVSNEDRGWLAQLVESRGIAPLDAQRRVAVTVENVRQDHERGKAALDQARKVGIMLSFIAAAAMLVGASSAWGGAVLGGNHRDENIGFNFITRW